MQETSEEFVEAVEGAAPTFVPTRIRTDWDGEGFSGPGSIDDLSLQAGRWEVTHHLDDGLPDEVSFVAGLGTPELEVALGGRSNMPIPGTVVSEWSTSTFNPGAGNGTTASITVPAGLTEGNWLVIIGALNSSTATITMLPRILDVLLGPTIDGTVVQTVVWAREVDADLAAYGETFTLTWDVSCHWTVVAASIGARSTDGRRLRMALIDADQTTETGTGTTHVTPTVDTVATTGVGRPITHATAVATFWVRGTTNAATWTMDSRDVEVVEAVGASGSGDNLDVAIGLTTTPLRATDIGGSTSRTATTTSTSNATMGIATFRILAPEVDSLSARAYWSPEREDSPVYGYDRDVAPVTLDVGVVTENGPEYVRVFTGQMADVPTQNGETALSAISASRLKLATLVHPPAVAGRYEGARADWVISYAMAASGIYLSPPPQAGCRWWAPMHGSVHSFIPSTNDESPGLLFFAAGGPSGSDNQTWVTGPYHLAPDLYFGPSTDANGQRGHSAIDISNTKRVRLADGDDFISQAGMRAKLEYWVYGDSATVNDFPAATASVLQGTWVSWQGVNSNTSQINMYIPASTNTSIDRRPTINVSPDGGGTNYTFRHSTAIPRDGQWHRVGFAYDFTGATRKQWINVDGVTETDNTSFATTAFPSVDTFGTNSPRFRSVMRVAEIQLTTGANANVDTAGWVHESSFTPTARMTPSLINLVNVAEREPREAWELIGSFAQAELAMLRADEHDVVNYLGQGWWVRDEQQVVVDSYDTATNAQAVPVTRDPTKIRNAVRVSYELAQSSTQWTFVAELSSEAPIPNGEITFTLPLSITAAELRGFTVAVNDGTGSQPSNQSYATLNTSSDGTGTYATSEQVTVTVVAWNPGAALVRINNRSNGILYLANDNGWPGLALAGKPHYTTSAFTEDFDLASIAARGERSLPVTVGGVQREIDARRVARELKSNLCKPITVLGTGTAGITLAGDPRRQPGDLVHVRDVEAGIDDELWRAQSVSHKGQGAAYTNTVTVRRTLPILVIGEGRIGETLIGPSLDDPPPRAI